MSKPKTFKSDFGIIDVKRGRAGLTRRIMAGEKVNVTINAVITRVWGHDDGVSREFELEVKSVAEAAE